MKIKKKYKKDLVISVPHAMHARNLFCSSFNFKETSLILGNFSSEVKKKLKKKTLCDIKNFNLIHLMQSKMISFYSIILDKEKKIDKNIFLKLVVKNYKNCDPNYKEIFKHHIDNNFNKIFFFILKILFIKHILSFLILTSSILIYYPMLAKYKPKKIFFACSNSSLDKGLIFLKKIFKFKIYGLINSWDHLSTKDF